MRRRTASHATDSAVAARLRQAGAVIMGKTHLHQLAYGITGENSEYGDCVQPDNPQVLTGGSSSGSAASVQEGSAVAAIGTDTGGSIRVPAALCGLAGYRSSLGLGGAQAWEGGVHLAVSFDTLGWLFRDLRDGPALAAALFDVPAGRGAARRNHRRRGRVFLHDCEPAVLEMYRGWQRSCAGMAPRSAIFEPDFWADSREIFGGIQAHEAAARASRILSITLNPRSRIGLPGAHRSPPPHRGFAQAPRWRFAGGWISCCEQHDFLMLPCAPMSALPVGVDHSATRLKILRYTTPISLAGTPAVTLAAKGGGVQLVAARGSDARLLAFAASLGEKIALRQ